MSLFKAIWKSIHNYSEQKTNVQLGIWCKVNHPAFFGIHEFLKYPNASERHCAFCGIAESLKSDK